MLIQKNMDILTLKKLFRGLDLTMFLLVYLISKLYPLIIVFINSLLDLIRNQILLYENQLK